MSLCTVSYLYLGIRETIKRSFIYIYFEVIVQTNWSMHLLFLIGSVKFFPLNKYNQIKGWILYIFQVKIYAA